MSTLDSIAVDDATLTSESETLDAVKSGAGISVENSTVEVASAVDRPAFSAAEGTAIDGSLVVVDRDNDLGGTAENGVVFMGARGTVYGEATLLDDLAVDTGETLTVPVGASLTIPVGGHLSIAEGVTLVNNGTIHVLGVIDSEDTIVCNSHNGGKATCSSRAICDVCHVEYGELDPTNHAHLEHVEAKAATTMAEGNVEYWFCDGCGKYFADAAAREETTQASTVLAKLPEQKSADKKGPVNKAKSPAKKLPQTGDEASALPVAMVLAGGIAFAAAALVAR